MLTWQSADTNEWTRAFRAAAGTTTAPKTPGPASLSDPDLIHNLLTTAGFTDIQLTSLTEPMYFGTDADDATAFIAEQFGLTHDDQVNALRASMADHQTDQGVFYDSATWLIQASTSAVAGHSTS
jgi:hypothetical protein